MAAEVPDRITEGSSAPDFRLAASTGNEVSLAQYQGKVHVVLFFVREYV
jgi:peroxiredoxin